MEGTETSAVVYATVQERGSFSSWEHCCPSRKIECSYHTNTKVRIVEIEHIGNCPIAKLENMCTISHSARSAIKV